MSDLQSPNPARDCLIARPQLFILALPMDETVAKYRQLDSREIIATVTAQRAP
jgi:hypothetical protein